MNDAPLTDREYADLAYKELEDWCRSDDEPEGDFWDLCCLLNGVQDPDAFADAVRYERRKRAERPAA